MSDTVTIWTRKSMTDHLLQRKQMATDSLHTGRASVSKTKSQEKLVKVDKTIPGATIALGFKQLGSRKTTDFGFM